MHDTTTQHDTHPRTQGRHLALKVLYQMGLTGITEDEAFAAIVEIEGRDEGDEGPPAVAKYAHRLVTGVSAEVESLDGELSPCLTAAWTFDRLGLLERTMLRMAAYEIRSVTEVPPRVSIDEAVELAKTYVGTDAARLVNGILHRFAMGVDPDGMNEPDTGA